MAALSRRQFLRTAGALAAVTAMPRFGWTGEAEATLPFQISLAQWSLHKALQQKELDNLQFAETARSLGIGGIEYVNQFFADKANDEKYLGEMQQRAADVGVKSVLIMCDREGNLGDPDEAKRAKAVENHHKWVNAAKFLGCHSIRVNAASAGSFEEQQKLAADGLSRLTEFASQHEINVIVENHGGLSSNGKWLSGVMAMVNHPRCGTLPDFGNFLIDRKSAEWYDHYQGVTELMPYAKGVSAKTYDFVSDQPTVTVDSRIKEDPKTLDYTRLLSIVLGTGYSGYIGIEYEGSALPEMEGIARSKQLLVAATQALGGN